MKKEVTQDAIRKLKEAAGYRSYYQLAKESSQPMSTINRYSSGRTSITLEKLAEYAENNGLKMEINFKKD